MQIREHNVNVTRLDVKKERNYYATMKIAFEIKLLSFRCRRHIVVLLLTSIFGLLKRKDKISDRARFRAVYNTRR